MACIPRYAKQITTRKSPLIWYSPISRYEPCHKTNKPNSPPAPEIHSFRTIILCDLGSSRRATLHDDSCSRAAGPTSIAARTASSPLPARAREPALSASTGSQSHCCSIRAAGHGYGDTVAVYRKRRGRDRTARKAAVSTNLAAAAVVVGTALKVAGWTLGSCNCHGRSCCRCSRIGG